MNKKLDGLINNNRFNRGKRAELNICDDYIPDEVLEKLNKIDIEDKYNDKL